MEVERPGTIDSFKGKEEFRVRHIEVVVLQGSNHIDTILLLLRWDFD